MQAIRWFAGMVVIAVLYALPGLEARAKQAENGCDQTVQLGEVPVKPAGITLLLPLLHQGKEYKLWEDDNAWQKAWRNALAAKNEKRIILPLGDIDDIKQVGVQDITSANYRALKALARKYGAQHILLVEADDAGGALAVHLHQVGGATFVTRHENFEGASGVAMAEAVEVLLADIADDIRAGRTEIVSKLPIAAPISSLAGWQQIQKRLEASDLLRGMDVQEITTSQVTLILSYVGDIDSFSAALRPHGLVLMREDEGWALRTDEPQTQGGGVALPSALPSAAPPAAASPAPVLPAPEVPAGTPPATPPKG